jgi:hypothetical protein
VKREEKGKEIYISTTWLSFSDTLLGLLSQAAILYLVRGLFLSVGRSVEMFQNDEKININLEKVVCYGV